jgi:phosphoglycolate phosphatase-like HAD superfamily hydrolase
MKTIEAIIFEPVGCLAEFPSGPFLELAFRLFGRKRKASQSGSRSYWHLLNLMQSANRNLDEPDRNLVETLELQAVAAANVYEDVVPALSELNAMGIKLFIASSLSGAAVTDFLARYSLAAFFAGAWNRDNSRGVKAAPLEAALACASLERGQVMFLADTLEGLKIAQAAGVHSILMMNDPDEARRLAMHNPSGGIVSLHELPDFIRLLAVQNSSPVAAAPFSSSTPPTIWPEETSFSQARSEIDPSASAAKIDN